MKKKVLFATLTLAAVATLSTTVLAEDQIEQGNYDNQIQYLNIGHSNCTHDLDDHNLDPEDKCHTMVLGFMYDNSVYWESLTESETTDPLPVSKYAQSGDNWSYDHASNTLTLSNFNGSGIWADTRMDIDEDATLNIKLIGDNTLTSGSNEVGNRCAIYSEGLDLNIQGPGTLEINAADGGVQVTGNSMNNEGVNGRFTLSNGAKVTVNNGLSATQIIVQSGCTLIANELDPVYALAADNIVVNGTLIATSPYEYGAIGAYLYCTAGPNVSFMTGDTSLTAAFASMEPLTQSAIYGQVSDIPEKHRNNYMAFFEEGVSSPPEATTPETPASTEITAIYNNSTLTVDGKPMQLEVYTINDNNYFKLRDLAAITNSTNKQFEVTWDGALNAINLKSNSSYTSVGGELATGDGANKNAVVNSSVVYLDGQPVELAAYTINDNNYFKLRDVCQTFDIGVTWSAEDGVGIDTSTSYVPEG